MPAEVTPLIAPGLGGRACARGWGVLHRPRVDDVQSPRPTRVRFWVLFHEVERHHDQVFKHLPGGIASRRSPQERDIGFQQMPLLEDVGRVLIYEQPTVDDVALDEQSHLVVHVSNEYHRPPYLEMFGT